MTLSSRCFAVALILLAACGGGPAGTDDDEPELPAPPPPPAVPFPAIAAALTVDPTNLPNYAAPTFPAYYQGIVGGPNDNGRAAPITNAGALLGRVLFHDPQLSVNGTVSCASCHTQGTGFTDARRFSVGFAGGQTSAHSMRLLNARFWGPGSFFWDRRAATLEAQATEPIIHPVEMGFDAAHGGLDALLTKLRGIAYYPELFRLAYGDDAITTDRLQRAVAQYVRSLTSVNSRWDQGYATTFNPGLPDRGVNAPLPNLTAEENRGRQLFFTPPPQGGANCAACHTAPTFSLTANSLSNGLDAGETRVFKSPSLKSVAVTGPYMHDGRFQTLEQVVDHYDRGVQDGPALDQRLRGPGGTPLRLNLTPQDRAALVAFLRTLTDDVIAGDGKFGDPFRR